MIITRFGDTYAAAYVLPTLNGEQPQDATRTPITATVSGADGEFDFFGAQPFPLAAKDLVVKGELHGTSYANIATLSIALKQATVSRGRSLLWAEMRDSTYAIPIVWAYAKCNVVQEGESSGKNYTNYPVSMTFRLSEGVWYAQTPTTRTLTGSGSETVVNAGDYNNSAINATWTAGASPIVHLNWRRMLGRYILISPVPHWEWEVNGPEVFWKDTYGDGLQPGEVLTLDSDELSVDIDGTDAYTDALGDPAITLGAEQVGWLTLNLDDWSAGTIYRDHYIQVIAIAGATISGVANTTPIQITTTVAHGLSSGDRVRLFDTSVCDGSYVITVTGLQTFTLNGTVASGTASSGRWIYGVYITGVTNSGAPITITTAIAHGLSNGDKVIIIGTSTDADGVWIVRNVTATQCDLREDYTGSDFLSYNTTTYVSGGFLCYDPGGTGALSWYQAFL